MEKYDIDLKVTFTVSVQVEADDIIDAQKKAMDNFYSGIYNSEILKAVLIDPEFDSAEAEAQYVENR